MASKKTAFRMSIRPIVTLFVSIFFVLIAACFWASTDFCDQAGSTPIRTVNASSHGSVDGTQIPNVTDFLYAPPGRQSGNAWKNPQLIPASGKALPPKTNPAGNLISVISMRPETCRAIAKNILPTAQFTGCTSPVRAGPHTEELSFYGIPAVF